MAHTRDVSTWEAETGRLLRVESLSGLHRVQGQNEAQTCSGQTNKTETGSGRRVGALVAQAKGHPQGCLSGKSGPPPSLLSAVEFVWVCIPAYCWD